MEMPNPASASSPSKPVRFFSLPRSRSALAKRVQVPRLGDSSHAAGDVQLQDAPHPASLPCSAPLTPPLARRCSTDQPEPAAPLVGTWTVSQCRWTGGGRDKGMGGWMCICARGSLSTGCRYGGLKDGLNERGWMIWCLYWRVHDGCIGGWMDE